MRAAQRPCGNRDVRVAQLADGAHPERLQDETGWGEPSAMHVIGIRTTNRVQSRPHTQRRMQSPDFTQQTSVAPLRKPNKRFMEVDRDMV